jgi:hypothetical protein
MGVGGMSPRRSRGDRRVPANVPANDVPVGTWRVPAMSLLMLAAEKG